MKVPVECDPEHHGDLTGRARGGLELAGGRVRDGRDEHGVIFHRGH